LIIFREFIVFKLIHTQNFIIISKSLLIERKKKRIFAGQLGSSRLSFRTYNLKVPDSKSWSYIVIWNFYFKNQVLIKNNYLSYM